MSDITIVPIESNNVENIESVKGSIIIKKGYSPYIGDDGYWYEYDENTNSFFNTGIIAGSGDMLKSVYDTNNDGVVDLASQADNADTVNNLTVETAVPENAVFTDTTYETVTAEANGLMSKEDKVKLNGVAEEANKTVIVSDFAEGISADTALASSLGGYLLEKVQALESARSLLLFSGAVKTGTITLTNSAFGYKYLVLYINSATDGIPFGTGILPTIAIPPSTPTVIFSDTTADNNHSTYMGKFLINSTDGMTITIERQVTNVTHITGKSHGGSSSYYVRTIYGVL
ncbi:hypothetical protein [uncultured Anaerofustis sp.]|uniref:hypothetical protein n=1 Tax=uncultured Anaerofustis sp. TaxID=904996 RepID=UPI0025EA36C5|nr:hypothetical protein [uncultured Anaerofustis sp.]